MNKILYSFIWAIVPMVMLTSCGKEKNDEAPNDFIAEQTGNYQITEWKKVLYSNNQEVSSTTESDVGVISLNVVNYGFYSEGTYAKSKEVDSEVLVGMNPELTCFDTFRWTGDENRLAIHFGWCAQQYDYTLTLDGFKDRKQTWTFVKTDQAGSIISKEVFEMKQE